MAHLDIGYDLTSRITLSAGAKNLCDRHPARASLIAADGSGANGNFAPFGFSGGFYHRRASLLL